MTSLTRRAGILAVAILTLAACDTAGMTSPAGPSTGPANPEVPISTAGTSAPSIGDPPPAGGELTLPKPGQVGPRDVPAELLEAAVDGRAVTLRITYTSGVEPCYVLDSVLVTPSDHAFAVTVREGHGPADMVCIEIAKQKHTIVELGELEPGTYTITDATGGAPPIEVVVG